MNAKKNILVTGANGQLGMEFRDLAKINSTYNFLFASKEELSITDELSLSKYFAAHHIDHCINCAAYTAVDKAETEKDLAYEVNATAVGYLAAICKKKGTQFIHISTDYAFDGTATTPYKESAVTNPVGIYGASKLAGEQSAIEQNASSIIIRTSWVYSHHGKNFVKTMIRLMKEKENIGVVNDQFGSPTNAADLAEAILEIIAANEKPPAGIYHYCNEGIINWYEFAVAIKQIIKSNCIVNPIPTSAYPTPANRPAYSVLDTTKIKQTFNLTIPSWKDSLEKCIFILENR